MVVADCTTQAEKCAPADAFLAILTLCKPWSILNQGSKNPQEVQHSAEDMTEVLTLPGSVHLYFTSRKDWSGASEVFPAVVTAKGVQFPQSDSQLNGTLHWTSVSAQLTTASLNAA